VAETLDCDEKAIAAGKVAFERPIFNGVGRRRRR
jgi:hypothetical protein